jgi:hypothetical protein
MRSSVATIMMMVTLFVPFKIRVAKQIHNASLINDASHCGFQVGLDVGVLGVDGNSYAYALI